MYIGLTEFARQKFVQGNLPEEKVVVKHNFLHPDPGVGEGDGDYVLFVGRLSKEKGLDTLLDAWERHRVRMPLKIVGDGPLASQAAQAAGRVPVVEWLGRRSKEQVLKLMKEAKALIFPSVWYEGFPMVLAEAYAVGLPVIASDLGSMSSLVDHGRTGLRFRPGDSQHLATQVEWMSTHPTGLQRMRRETRAEFENKYTAERNYESLMSIYRTVIDGARVRA